MGNDCRQQLSIQTCGQTAAKRNMVTTDNLPGTGIRHRPIKRRYRGSPTTYRLATIYALQMTDHSQTDRQHIVPKARPNGRPKMHSTST